MKLTVRYDALTPDLYARVRASADFFPYDPDDVRAALDGSFCTAVVYADDEPAGIGRVVADGRIAFFIKDLVVLPQYQGCGIGSAVLEALVARIRLSCCDHAYVGLLAATGKEGFYERHGFLRRPTNDLGSGMIRFVDHIAPSSPDQCPPPRGQASAEPVIEAVDAPSVPQAWREGSVGAEPVSA